MDNEHLRAAFPLRGSGGFNRSPGHVKTVAPPPVHASKKRRLLLAPPKISSALTQSRNNFQPFFEEEIEEVDDPKEMRNPFRGPSKRDPIFPDFRTTEPSATWIPSQNYDQQCVRVQDVFDEGSPFQPVFPYSHFNAMQSQCLVDTYRSDTSFVVSAPTGSGKTVIFELAICRMFSQVPSSTAQQVLYVAPLKALVQERTEDWTTKFSHAGLTCSELTSDTSEDVDWKQIRSSQILLCTPEKWDQVTRKEEGNLSNTIGLVLLDEIHVITENRGACLEAIVTRMKLWSHRKKLKEEPEIRFVAVSATCPNLEDIGKWLNVSSESAIKKFGKEYRPVPLVSLPFLLLKPTFLCLTMDQTVSTEVIQEGKNQFLWDRNLKFRLFSVVQKYSNSLPSLVFCSSRKSAQDAALQLITEARTSARGFSLTPAQVQRLRSVQIKDKTLAECVIHGIAFYHAGLGSDDRKLIQSLFLAGDLRVVSSTSSLAMGVNLPAHLVVICGTKYYRSGTYEDLDSISILQMIGRAGRPQFDSSAVAIILTDRSGEKKYKNLIEGQERIESSLHHSLAEHLNSEIVMRTICNPGDAIGWVKSTFLYVRLMNNPSPKFYQLEGGGFSNLCVEKLEKWIRTVLEEMQVYNLVTIHQDGTLFSTKLGKALSVHRTNYATMKLYSLLESDSEFPDIMRCLCSSTEFAQIVLRRNEKRALNEYNKNSEVVRYPVGKLVRDSIDKICVLLQAVLSDQKIEDWSLRTEVNNFLSVSLRIVRCLMAVLEEKKFAKPLYFTIRLAQCIESHLWYDSDYVCRQLDGIGATHSKSFFFANIRSLSELKQTNPRKIESLIKRNPPAGNLVLENLDKIWPQIELAVRIAKSKPVVEVVIAIVSHNSADVSRHKYRGRFSRLLVIHEKKNVLLFSARVKNFCVEPLEFFVGIQISEFEDDPEFIVLVLNESYVGMDVAQTIYLGDLDSGIRVEEISATSFPKEKRKIRKNPKNPKNPVQNEESGKCKHTCRRKESCKHACCKKQVPDEETLPPKSDSDPAVPKYKVTFFSKELPDEKTNPASSDFPLEKAKPSFSNPCPKNPQPKIEQTCMNPSARETKPTRFFQSQQSLQPLGSPKKPPSDRQIPILGCNPSNFDKPPSVQWIAQSPPSRGVSPALNRYYGKIREFCPTSKNSIGGSAYQNFGSNPIVSGDSGRGLQRDSVFSHDPKEPTRFMKSFSEDTFPKRSLGMMKSPQEVQPLQTQRGPNGLGSYGLKRPFPFENSNSRIWQDKNDRGSEPAPIFHRPRSSNQTLRGKSDFCGSDSFLQSIYAGEEEGIDERYFDFLENEGKEGLKSQASHFKCPLDHTELDGKFCSECGVNLKSEI